ncbi:MAG: MFS transporter [Ardenticatenaceae bacterium]
MNRKRDFFYITLADFIVRSAYQMGKTPLLPLFAASLGATGAFLGLIVSVSTVTGLLLKPLFGILSDRWGRRAWLIIGTCFFAGVPFLYRFVHTPEQLFAIRLLHGLSTAIYGPVTLAYIATRSRNRIAEDVGWFEMARSGGYIVGPALAGWLLLSMPPAAVFTIIGLVSALAFVPVLLLEDIDVQKKILTRSTRSNDFSRSGPIESPKEPPALQKQLIEALKAGAQVPAIWLSGGLKAASFVALYINKAFLPLYANSVGLNALQIGLFFSVQEGAHILLKAFGGRLGDKIGHLLAIALGMGLLSISLPLLTLFNGTWDLLLLALLMGAAEALIFPSAVALVSNQVDKEHLGAAMGLTGMMDNLGKVIGPVLGGLFIARLGFAPTYYIIAALLLLSTLLLLTLAQKARLRHPLKSE